MTGRWPMGQSGNSLLNRSITNAIPSFIRLSRFEGWRAISAIMPIWNQKKRLSVIFSTHHHQKNTFFTHRQPVIHHTVTVVTAIPPGCVLTKHHLVPPSVLAQMLGEACQIAFGQPLQLLHHLLSLVHGVKTVHPKHDLYLDFEGQHVAKRLVFGVDESLVFHVDR